MQDYKITRHPSIKLRMHLWTRFFTLTYWRFQLAALWGGKAGLNVIETFEIEIPFDVAQDVPDEIQKPPAGS